MFWNTVILALVAIRRNLLRSFLTVLGIVIGVAAVVTMMPVRFIRVAERSSRAARDSCRDSGVRQRLPQPVGKSPGPRPGPIGSFVETRSA